MKTLTAIAVIAALVGGISTASAQNAPTTKLSPSPNSINKGSRPTAPSGTEDRSTATGTPRQIAGNGKYCKETSANGTLDCFYASLAACKKQNKSNALQCVVNPHRGT